ITFDPSSSIYNVGKQLWIIGTDGDECYKDYNSSAYNVTIIGDIVPVIEKPIQWQKFYKDDTIQLNSTIYDDNHTIVSGTTINWTLEETSEFLGNEENTTWQIPINHGLGQFTVNLTSNKTYYNTGSDQRGIEIWSKANTSLLTTPPASLYRGDNLSLEAEVRDYFNNSGVQDYTCRWWWGNGTYQENIANTTTNQSGICNYTWETNCSYWLGIYWLNVTIENETSKYYDAWVKEDNLNTTLRDNLSINIDSPTTNQILHRTATEQLNSTVSDYCGTPPKDPYQVTWYNESWDQIATSDNTTWQVPVDYTLGSEIIRANATGSYYDTGTDQVSVLIYGWSNLSQITTEGLVTHQSDKALAGEIVEVKCRVEDANTTQTVPDGYEVGFYEFNSTGYLVENLTNTTVSGYAYWYWNTTEEDAGNYTIICNITDQASLYYNASEADEKNKTVEIERKLYVYSINIDNQTIYRNDTFDPHAANITVQITESVFGGVDGATAHFWEGGGEFDNCTTDSAGYCWIIYNSSDTKTPGNYTILINATKTGSNPSDPRETWIVTQGLISISITKPQANASYHKTENVTLSADTRSENGDPIAPTVNWFNSTWDFLVQGGENNTEVNWTIPANYKLGQETLHANATLQWYDSDHDQLNITIWGWSNISFVYPTASNYSYGDPINLECLVSDANSSKGIDTYPVDFWYNTTKISSNLTNSSGYVTHYWEPPQLGNFLLRCNITDNSTLYYNDSVSEATVSINIIDTTEPEIRNINITPILLETYQSLELWANVTDDINVSKVWVYIEKPDANTTNVTLTQIPGSEYNLTEAYPTLYGALYNESYTPDVGGIYNATFYANDTTNNVNYTIKYQFEAIPKTDVDTELLPDTYTVYNISQDLSQEFDMNVTCNNTGNATAYSTNITLQLPSGWTSNITFPQNCGDVTNGSYCFKVFNVTVPANEQPGDYMINTTCEWRNPDLTTNSSSDNSTITVASNPILEVEEAVISGSVDRATEGYVNNFTVNSTGNDVL
ncbi:MAG: NEW3 domain-containing protein, partial [Candidatus Aenigmarchaeota archaeon]|nr:NEW3 domain-containing protein [Candidatus Aenigmarchaeota archaeon]